MIRSFVAFLLIFSVLAVHFGRCFVYAGYNMNRSYIAARLCVNKDKPKLHCNGKCYLAKKLKQEEEKEKKDEKQSQKNLLQEAIITSETKLKAPCSFTLKHLFRGSSFILPTHSVHIFQPPQAPSCQSFC